MQPIRIIALALAALMLSVTGRAATVITAEVGKDDGGYWDIGTQGSLGSDLQSTNGKAFGAWIRTHDVTISPVVLNWFSVGMPNWDNVWQLNSYWTVDYGPNTGYVLLRFSGTDGQGWIMYQNVGATVNFNDGAYHHHFVSWTGFSSGKPTGLVYYIDGQALSSWTDVSDSPAFTGTSSDFTQSLYIASTAKTSSNTPTDMSTLDIEDLRIYTRGLSADEVKQIYKMRGRDMIRRGLLSRYPFWTDGKNLGASATNTKWYFTNTTQSSGYTEKSTDTATKTETNAGNLKKMTVAKDASVTTPSITNSTNTAEKWFFRAFASPALEAQTVSAGTVTFRAAPIESNANLNHFMKWYCYVLRGGSNVATIAGPADEATESTTSSTNAGREHAVSFSSFTLQTGDQIVVEMWSGGTAANTTNYTHQPKYGGTTDITDGTTNSSPASNVEFSTPIIMKKTATAEHTAGGSVPTLTTDKVLSGARRKVQ